MILHEEYDLPTPLGKLMVVPQGLDKARVHSDARNGGMCYLLIRGVPVTVACHLVYERGEWRTAMGNRGPLPWTFYRNDAPSSVAVSESAQRAAKNAVLEAVTKYHSDHPESFVAAERRTLRAEFEKAQAAEGEARDALSAAEDALEVTERRIANFEAVYPPGEARPECVPESRRKGVRLLSSGLINTPGIMAYMQTAYKTGDAAVAVKSLMEGYDLSRWEAIGLLSGEIPHRVAGDVVEFHSPYREGADE